MNYSSCKAEDLVLNPEFREWVVNPTPATNDFWENWLKTHPDKLQEVKEAKEILRKFPIKQHAIREEEVDKIWESIEKANSDGKFDTVRDNMYPLNAETVISRFELKTKGRSKSVWKKSLRFAASLTLVVAAALWYLNITSLEEPEAAVDIPIAEVTRETQRGQKSTIYLKDGSKVMLNANSKLTYPEQFSNKDRLVTLEGEAFFEVSKDLERPFQVKTGDLITTALGTSFNVNTQKNGTHVALATGKVLVSNNIKPKAPKVILAPGQDAWYYPETENLVAGYFDYDLILGWKDQTIVFNKAKEKDVFSTLENWYDVDITKTNSPSSPWDYSGEFKKMDLKSVLLSISFTMDFEYTIKEQKVTITYH